MIRLMFYCVVPVLTIVSGKGVHEMKIDKGFSWKNCDKTAPMYFKQLSVSPNPIKYGGSILLSAELEVTQDIGTSNTLTANVTANEIYQGQKFDMCPYRPKACHIENICQVISQAKMKCPDVVKKEGSDCHCPLKKKIYNAKDIKIQIPNPKLQIEGQFEVTVNLTELHKPVGCLFMEFCLGDCSLD